MFNVIKLPDMFYVFGRAFQNCSFLDVTWTIPVYRTFEFVPCTDLGIQVL